MKVWIDLENSPHVPFFRPIVRELEARGIEVILTARAFAQTVSLIELYGLKAEVIGSESGTSPLQKAKGIMLRSVQLARYIRKHDVTLGVGHGSRGLVMACRLLRTPSLTLYDYEGASVGLFHRLSKWIMVPEVLSAHVHHRVDRELLTYPGLKEELYLPDFKPDPSIHERLGTDPTRILITARPPSVTAHYQSSRSHVLFDEVLERLVLDSSVQIVLLVRNQLQRDSLKQRDWYNAKNVIHPSEVEDGMNLLFHSDLLIGGGGTMNREAAVLGLPVLSVFKGEEGAVDKMLREEGRLFLLTSASEIDRFLQKRDRQLDFERSLRTREAIVGSILKVLEEIGDASDV